MSDPSTPNLVFLVQANQAVLHYTLTPLPLQLLLIIIILLLLLLILLLFLLFKEVWKASRPSLLSCRDLCDRHLPPPPPGYKILTGVKLSTIYKIWTSPLKNVYMYNFCFGTIPLKQFVDNQTKFKPKNWGCPPHLKKK